MGTWKYDSPPTWKRDAVATNSGWCHPITGEVLAACPGLLDKRRGKLDKVTSNLMLENGGFFVLETPNSDNTSNYLVLE